MILFVFVQFACYHIMKTIGEYFSSLLNMSIFCRDLEDEKNEKEEKKEEEKKEEEKKEKEEAVEKERKETTGFSSWFSRREPSVKEESLDEKNKNEDETFKLIDVFEKPGDENVNDMFKTNF